MKKISHKEKLEPLLMKEYRKQYYNQKQEKSLRKKMGALSIFSITGVTAIAAAVFITTVSTVQPTTVTAQELIDNVRTHGDTIRQLKENESYTFDVKETITRNSDTYIGDPSQVEVIYKTYTTDGKNLRIDTSNVDNIPLTSSILRFDSETAGDRYQWRRTDAELIIDQLYTEESVQPYVEDYTKNEDYQENKELYDDLSKKQYFKGDGRSDTAVDAMTAIFKEHFEDYPISGSIFDTEEALNLPHIQLSNDSIENVLEQEFETDFFISSEEAQVDGVAAYELTGYSLPLESLVIENPHESLKENMIERKYWISKEGNRLLKEEVINKNLQEVYQKYYFEGKIQEDKKMLEFDQWKKDFLIDSNDINMVTEYPDTTMTPHRIEENLSQDSRVRDFCTLQGISIEECIDDLELRQRTVHSWNDCVQQTDAAQYENIEKCTDDFITKIQEKEVFFSFCDDTKDVCEEKYSLLSTTF